ncbi:hypothetical protein BKI52_20825 [marine bacterium AO1-C]|nr:hypothetical protein BKI52_20825 [marine bacterium AO1-C]
MKKDRFIGTYEWSLKTEGNLNLKEKITLIRMLLEAQTKDMLQGLLYRSGIWKHKLKRVDLGKIQIPDSQTSKEAIKIAESTYSPTLLNHCYRTYYFARVLAQVDQFNKIDEELLFVGAMLHDLGLTPQNLPKAATCCFTMDAAHFSKNFALEHQWNEQRANSLFTSISAHLNPVINPTIYGKESYLLGGGAFMDMLGKRHYTAPKPTMEQIHQKYPRAQFMGEIVGSIPMMKSPNTRAGFLKKLGFATLAAQNPLEKRWGG